MIYLIVITNIDKICDYVGLKFKFLNELIGYAVVTYKIEYVFHGHVAIMARMGNINQSFLIIFQLCKKIKTKYDIQKDRNLEIKPYKPSVLFVGHVQTVQTQIRCRSTLRLISVSTVCLHNFLLKLDLKRKLPTNTPKI